MTSRARVLAATLALSVVLVVSGCVSTPQPVVTRLPTDRPAASSAAPSEASARPSATTTPVATSPTSPPPSGDVTDCAGAAVALAGSSQAFTITGDCPDVQVAGNAVTVDATAAVVGTATISGDRIRFDAGVIEALTVEGNDDTVGARSIGSLVIRGDRHVVTAPEGISSVVISGNDNVVDAGTSGTVADQGQRNSIG